MQRSRDPAEKQARILEAAEALFAEQGFDQTSTMQIAERAGVSEGIIFHHFGSKKGLFQRLGENFAKRAAEATMPSDKVELTEEIVVRSAFDFADNNPALYEALQKGSAELNMREVTALNRGLIDAISQNLKSAMASGMIRQGDVTIMAELQFAVVDAAYRAWRATQNPELRDRYMHEAVVSMKAMLQHPK